MSERTLAARFGPCTCRKPDGSLRPDQCSACLAFQEWQHSPEMIEAGEVAVRALDAWDA